MLATVRPDCKLTSLIFYTTKESVIDYTSNPLISVSTSVSISVLWCYSSQEQENSTHTSFLTKGLRVGSTFFNSGLQNSILFTIYILLLQVLQAVQYTQRGTDVILVLVDGINRLHNLYIDYREELILDKYFSMFPFGRCIH